MTRRRSRSEGVCQCADHRRHAYVPADLEAAEAALGRFERALTLLPDPLAGAISTLTIQDVRIALSRASDRDRAAVFQTVGLPKINPKKNYGDRLCEDVLTRLRDASRFDVRRATLLLTVPVAPVLFGWIGAQTVQKPNEWPDALARLALWTGMQADAGYVRILLAAAQQDWWCPPGVSAELGESLLEAARDVVQATPDYLSSAEDESDSFPPSDGEPEPETAEFADRGAEMAEEPDLHVLIEKLDMDWAEARASAARVSATLDSGLPAESGDLTAMTRFAETMATAEDRVRLIGADPETSTAPALREALLAFERELSRQQDRERLRLLTGLAGDGLTRELEILGTTLETLQTSQDWDADQKALVSGLLAVGEIVDLVEAEGGLPADRSRLKELVERTRALPADLAQLPTMALMQNLQWRTELPIPASESVEQAGSEHLTGRISPTDHEEPESPPMEPTTSAAAAGPHSAETEPSRSEPNTSPSERSAKAEPTDESPKTTAANAEPAEQNITEGLSALVAARRFSAAHAVAAAAGRPETELWAYRVSALAEAIRSDTGPCAARLDAELASVTEIAPEPLPLMLAVPALVRVALITGTATAGALLTGAAAHLDRDLGQIADRVGRRMLQGVQLDTPLIGVLADVSELERRITDAREGAQQRLRRRTLRLQRATEIAKAWLAPDGPFGALLSAAAVDDRAAIPWVVGELKRLSDPVEVHREIDRLDHRLRASSAKPLVGAARQNLLSLAVDALAAVGAWIEAVAVLERQAGHDRARATSAIAVMRTEILSRREAALAGISASRTDTDPLLAAAAMAGTASLASVFALLDGSETLSPGEPLAEVALTVECLKLPDAWPHPETGKAIMRSGTPSAPSSLLDAFNLSWAEAFASHVEAENYVAAQAIARLVENGWAQDGVLPPEAAATLRAAEHRSRNELRILREELQTQLQRARLNSQLSEEEDAQLAAILKDADPDPATRLDLHKVRRELESISELLPGYRAEAARRLNERLDKLAGRPGSAEQSEKITQLIDEGSLATAEEFVNFLESGKSVPTLEARKDLETFFPAVPDALGDGITKKLIDVVKAGDAYTGMPALDYSGLSEEAGRRAAECLETWRLLASATSDSPGRLPVGEYLLPALRAVGLEASRIEPLKQFPRDKQRRFVEATGVRVIGKALVPAFGTRLGVHQADGGRLRILLAWGRPTAELLMSWVDQDTSGEAVLVMHFGTMSAQVRRALAARAVASPAPVIVLDDAALAYLAAHGDGQFDATMAITLPFSAVNPYRREKRGLVAREMFYGRDRERLSVLDPDGTQLIFGGRGLGKSALLRDSKARFEREPEWVAVYVESKVIGTLSGGLGAEAIWDQLRRELIEADVLPAARLRTSARGQTSAGDPYDAVRTGVLTWLDNDSRRRLLVLLDESDGFFESDAPRFIQTQRLKELGQTTDHRMKVVFAGLHSVQRFTKIAGNGPFSHLAQRPTVIGPLAPQHALDLLVRPLDALGFVFDDDLDLVTRILGHCSYQPFLLQMFGHRLVEAMQTRRASESAGPPHTITAADVDAVESDPELKDDITRAFRDTLYLDPRYNVIANVLAHHAYEHGMDTRLTDVELNDECEYYWPQGFESLDVEGFRAYLHEMVGLGVLMANNDGLGWRLRSQNVLRMVGTADDVMAELVRAARESVPPEDRADETRKLLTDRTTQSPLTAAQLADVLGDRVNQVRLVLGSEATGIKEVAKTIQAMAQELGYRFAVEHVTRRGKFQEAITGGIPGERRVVVSDLAAAATKPEGCKESVEMALSMRPDGAGVTRSVVLIADPSSLPFWSWAMANGDPRYAFVALRRYTRHTLKIWALDNEAFVDSVDDVYRVTSGWPHLVERTLKLKGRTSNEPRVLASLEADLATTREQASLLNMVGLHDEQLGRAFNDIVAFADESGATFTDLIEAAAYSQGHPDPETAVRCLIALQVFDFSKEGRYHVDPLLANAWRALHH